MTGDTRGAGTRQLMFAGVVTALVLGLGPRRHRVVPAVEELSPLEAAPR